MSTCTKRCQCLLPPKGVDVSSELCHSFLEFGGVWVRVEKEAEFVDDSSNIGFVISRFQTILVLDFSDGAKGKEQILDFFVVGKVEGCVAVNVLGVGVSASFEKKLENVRPCDLQSKMQWGFFFFFGGFVDIGTLLDKKLDVSNVFLSGKDGFVENGGVHPFRLIV